MALFQLPDVSLIISVYNKHHVKRKDFIGWFSVGKNSSGEEEITHWNDMKDAEGQQVRNETILFLAEKVLVLFLMTVMTFRLNTRQNNLLIVF